MKGKNVMLEKEFLVRLIANSSVAGDMESVTALTDMLNELEHPTVEKKKRAQPNKSGYVQLDAETGKEVARFATIKEANAAMGKKPGASCISQACRNFKLGKSNKAYGFAWVYGEDYKG